MPRAPGQIDKAKNEAILDAAAEVWGAKGFSASIDAIARAAGVSKQTIYNHYGSKDAVIRALVARRVSLITAPLGEPGAFENPQEALTELARIMMETVYSQSNGSMMRAAMLGGGEANELAVAFFEAGPRASRARLTAFIAEEMKAGRLAEDDPELAAEFFSGMVTGYRQIKSLMGLLEQADLDAIPSRAKACAARFMRAYAP